MRETQEGARKLLAQHDVVAGGHRACVEALLRSPTSCATRLKKWRAHAPARRARRRLRKNRSLPSSRRALRGTTGVLVFGRPRQHGFARATAVLDQLGLTIVDARITPTEDGFSLDLYHVLEDDGAPITRRRPAARDRACPVALGAAAGRCAAGRRAAALRARPACSTRRRRSP